MNEGKKKNNVALTEIKPCVPGRADFTTELKPPQLSALSMYTTVSTESVT